MKEIFNKKSRLFSSAVLGKYYCLKTLRLFFIAILGILFIHDNVFAKEKNAPLQKTTKVSDLDPNKVVGKPWSSDNDPDKKEINQKDIKILKISDIKGATRGFWRDGYDLSRKEGDKIHFEITEEVLDINIMNKLDHETDNDKDKKETHEQISAVVTLASQSIISQDFEGTFPAPGWNVSVNSDTCADASWDDQSYRANNGLKSAWCASLGSESPPPGANYPNNMCSWMVYGPFDLSDASDAALYISLWLNSEPDYDFFVPVVSINSINFYGWSFSGNTNEIIGNTNGWLPLSFDLKAVPTLGDLTGEPQVWIAFIFTSDSSVSSGEGAYVDDIVIWKEVQSCGDGILDPGEECDDNNTENGDCCSATCSFEPAGTACGDPSDTACDDPDTCNGSGTCLPNNEPPGTSCDDGNVCNGIEFCDPGNVCLPGTPLICDDGIVCTVDNCDAINGCSNIPNDTLCDDGQWCNGSEVCDAINDCQPGTASDCTDNVSCTDDSCNEVTDSCDNIPNNTNCDDGDACTSDNCDLASGQCENVDICDECCPDGDVNEDGQVTAFDAQWILEYIEELRTLDACELVHADVNQDGTVSELDALCILQKIVQLPSCLDDSTCPLWTN